MSGSLSRRYTWEANVLDAEAADPRKKPSDEAPAVALKRLKRADA